MTTASPEIFIKSFFRNSLEKLGSSNEIQTNLDEGERAVLNIIIKNSSKKGLISVTLTSLIYKILHSTQDIRLHQDGMEGGYSGRTFDNKYVVPFLKSENFSAAAESGWLSRSFETKDPYTLDYPAAISPKEAKIAFLLILDTVQRNDKSKEFLDYLFQGLILQRNAHAISLLKPAALSISKTVDLLKAHFNSKFSSEGASRLPVLALYAVYQCLLLESKRFLGKKLLALEKHTASDIKKGRIGDINIANEDNDTPFESIEVKHGIPITKDHIITAYNKFATTKVKRYYLLSTADVDNNERDKIDAEIERIKSVHGCQVIANGLIPSLKYYLRLIIDTSEFISNYVELIEKDDALKFEHRSKWNELVSSL